MKILFLCFHGLDPSSGVSKKIMAQVDALKSLGHTVWLHTYDVLPDGRRVRRIDGEVIADFGTTILAPIRKRCCYKAVEQFVRDKGVELVYARSYHNANPFTIALFEHMRQSGARVVVEIPTWPYDQEYSGMPLKYRLNLVIDKMFRRRLAKAIDAFVTFASVSTILGQRAIAVSNGFAIPATTLLQNVQAETTQKEKAIRLLAVAEVHFWHGFDRAVEGMGLYKGDTPVELHIVGGIAPEEMLGSDKAKGIGTLIERYGLRGKVILHGPLHGEALEEQYRLAHFGIGSLGRHRSGITAIKTLKNREYAARGLAFCYSEQDDDFDNQPYVMRVAPDETPLDIEAVVQFVKHQTMTRQEINASVQHLSWPYQMQKVIQSL